MNIIKESDLIDLIKNKFPEFCFYWNDYVNKNGEDDGITIKIISFCHYAIHVIKMSKEDEIKELFNFVEFLVCNGDSSVKNAICTTFLEYLLSLDPDEIQFSKFCKYLGEHSIAYCKAWDEFTGCRTEGLW